MTDHTCGDGGSMGFREPSCVACNEAKPATPATIAAAERAARQAWRKQNGNPPDTVWMDGIKEHAAAIYAALPAAPVDAASVAVTECRCCGTNILVQDAPMCFLCNRKWAEAAAPEGLREALADLVREAFGPDWDYELSQGYHKELEARCRAALAAEEGAGDE